MNLGHDLTQSPYKCDKQSLLGIYSMNTFQFFSSLSFELIERNPAWILYLF